MADCIEKEKLGNDESLDEHDGACGNDCYQADDVHDPDGIEDDVAWAGQ